MRLADRIGQLEARAQATDSMRSHEPTPERILRLCDRLIEGIDRCASHRQMPAGQRLRDLIECHNATEARIAARTPEETRDLSPDALRIEQLRGRFYSNSKAWLERQIAERGPDYVAPDPRGISEEEHAARDAATRAQVEQTRNEILQANREVT